MASSTSLIEGYLSGLELVQQGVAGMTRQQLLARPVPGKWSTLEVVCHLVDSEQAWVHRMKRVIAEDRPLLVGYDETRFSAALGYQERDLEEELALLGGMRSQMARVLRALPAAAWNRTGVHTERGLITLEQMVALEAEHITHHVKFIHDKRRALGLKSSA
jgi:DinB superfamily